MCSKQRNAKKPSKIIGNSNSIGLSDCFQRAG